MLKNMYEQAHIALLFFFSRIVINFSERFQKLGLIRMNQVL